MDPPGSTRDYPSVDRERTRTLRTRVSSLALLALAGCDRHIGCAPVLTGENEQLEFHEDQLVVGSCGRLREKAPLAVGARWCPRIECTGEDNGCEVDDEGNKVPADQVLACFEETVEGPVTRDGDCFTVDAAGTLVWTFVARPCEANSIGYDPEGDRLSLPLVDLMGLTVDLRAPNDVWALDNLHPGAEPWPEDAALVPGAVALAVADRPVLFTAVLRDGNGDDVGWNPEDAQLVVDLAAGSGGNVSLDARGVVTAELPAGTRVDLTVRWQGTDFALGSVEGVADAELTSMEVLVGYLPDEDDAEKWSVPIGARAVLRRDDGAPVHGAEVDWEVTDGALPVWRDPTEVWNPDYVALMDEDGNGCHPPPKTSRAYAATIVARHGELEAEADLEWIERPEDDSTLGQIVGLFKPEDHHDSELCQGPGFPVEGCACGSANGSAPGGLALLVLLVGSRRRRLTAH